VNGRPLDILYIGGFGRSGSTLLERCLAQREGFCAVGEMRHVWDRSFAHDQLCGCGQPFRACAFWQAVVARAFGGFDRVDATAMMALGARVNRTRYVPYLTVRPTRRYRADFARYAAALRPLYEAVRAVSGCRVIIDSSKEPSYACVLQAMPGVRLSVVHLVRDSRAVAFSWLKKKPIPDVHWKTAYMHRYSVTRSALWWLTFNGLCHGFAVRPGRYLRLYYEEFARDPGGALARVLRHLGEPASLPFVQGRTVTLGVDHTVSGNPTRFLRGAVEVRPDEAWRTEMAARDRRLVTACTAPYLLAYGYFRAAAPPARRPEEDIA
jgi:Sulfotransferase family